VLELDTRASAVPRLCSGLVSNAAVSMIFQLLLGHEIAGRRATLHYLFRNRVVSSQKSNKLQLIETVVPLLYLRVSF
jgi:hypothetical protein